MVIAKFRGSGITPHLNKVQAKIRTDKITTDEEKIAVLFESLHDKILGVLENWIIIQKKTKSASSAAVTEPTYDEICKYLKLSYRDNDKIAKIADLRDYSAANNESTLQAYVENFMAIYRLIPEKLRPAEEEATEMLVEGMPLVDAEYMKSNYYDLTTEKYMKGFEELVEITNKKARINANRVRFRGSVSC